MKAEIKNNLIRQHESLKRALKTMNERKNFLSSSGQVRPTSYVQAEISATNVAIYLIEAEQIRVNVQLSRIKTLENKNGVRDHN